MKNFLDKAYTYLGVAKVACICVAALYPVFWFYRFFNFPAAEFLAPIFDFVAKAIPLPFETTKIDGTHIAENAYFIMGLVLSAVAFILSVLEDLVLRAQKQQELHEIRTKRKLENEMNEQLEREYIASIMKYKYFSVLLKYKIKYVNEVIAQHRTTTTEEIEQLSYKKSAENIKRSLATINLKQNDDYIFITAEGFEKFDAIITSILNTIKIIRSENEKYTMRTDFLIVVDAQDTEAGSLGSLNNLRKIARLGDFNRALATLSFKIRFDLMKDKSNYMVDAMGFTVALGSAGGDDEIFTLKTRPKFV